MILSTALVCLAATIYMEARGEPERGKIKVGLVVLNRAEAEKMKICDVIKVPGQFSWYNSNIIKPRDLAGWNASLEAAKDAIVLFPFQTSLPTHFHNTQVRPVWSKYKVKVARIGNHIFYEDKKAG